MKSLKDKSLASLIKEADAVFSTYIRVKNSESNGLCKCFICGTRMVRARMHNGHFIDRDQMPTRYDEMNCHPVCPECNCFDPDHKERYTNKMVNTYGLFEVGNLKIKSMGMAKFMRHELQEIIDSYKQKIKELSEE